jgi:hypothetical protein
MSDIQENNSTVIPGEAIHDSPAEDHDPAPANRLEPVKNARSKRSASADRKRKGTGGLDSLGGGRLP